MLLDKLTTPILFLVFNRPSTTQVVFEAIRKAKPTSLYIASDGPRGNVPGDIEKCAAVRAIVSNVDWECDVKTLYREENFGCGKGVSGAITWFFQQEPEGIILEDDCLPVPEFFPFCTDLLEKYRNDTRIMQIGGNNLLSEIHRSHEYSYFFSNHNSIWGWATWRRAWDLYDYNMRLYDDVMKNGFFNDHFSSIYEEDYFTWVFKRTHIHPHITWDYQWEFIRRINSGLTIVPQKNLVVNIGFGSEATHTTDQGGASSKLQMEEIGFPLRHPEFVMVDSPADRRGFIDHLTYPTSRVKTVIKRMLPPFVRKKMFEISFKRYLNSNNKTIEVQRSSSNTILSWMNMSYLACELDMDLFVVLLAV